MALSQSPTGNSFDEICDLTGDITKFPEGFMYHDNLSDVQKAQISQMTHYAPTYHMLFSRLSSLLNDDFQDENTLDLITLLTNETFRTLGSGIRQVLITQVIAYIRKNDRVKASELLSQMASEEIEKISLYIQRSPITEATEATVSATGTSAMKIL